MVTLSNRHLETIDLDEVLTVHELLGTVVVINGTADGIQATITYEGEKC